MILSVTRSHPGAAASVAALASAAAMLLLTGCSGSSANSHAVLRSVNAIAEAGRLTMTVNAGAVNGTQTYGTGSDYLYVPQDGTATVKFILSNVVDTNASPYPLAGPLTFDVTGNTIYTLVAYGNPAEPESSVRTPNVLVLDDNDSAIPPKTALLRIVNVAPDAGTIDYSLNGGTSTEIAYGATSGTSQTNGYLSVPSGSVSLQVASATTGAAFPIPNPTLTLQAGNAYTVFFTEPTVVDVINNGVTTTTGTISYGTFMLTDR